MGITVTNVYGKRDSYGSSGKYFSVGIDLKKPEVVQPKIEDEFDGLDEAPDVDGLVDGSVTAVEISRDELKAIADSNGIEYQPNIKTTKLKELVKDYL